MSLLLLRTERLTGEGSARRAKHEEQKQLFQATLSGASKRCAGSSPAAAKPVVDESGDPQTWASNRPRCPFLLPDCGRYLLQLRGSCSWPWSVSWWRLSGTGIASRSSAERGLCTISLTRFRLPAQRMRPQSAFGGGTACIFAPPSKGLQPLTKHGNTLGEVHGTYIPQKKLVTRKWVTHKKKKKKTGKKKSITILGCTAPIYILQQKIKSVMN